MFRFCTCDSARTFYLPLRRANRVTDDREIRQGCHGKDFLHSPVREYIARTHHLFVFESQMGGGGTITTYIYYLRTTINLFYSSVNFTFQVRFVLLTLARSVCRFHQ